MTTRRTPASILAGLLMGAAATLTACSSQPSADIPRITEKTFTLKPSTVPVRIGILTGDLSGLSVFERVNAETGAVVYAPQLRGTLKLTNTSSDQAVRLVTGQIEYLDATGARIALTDDRADTKLRLSTYSSDRLDPGKETTHSVDVPFPAAALDGTALAEIRLSVTYLPAPYRRESVEVPVALAGRN